METKPLLENYISLREATDFCDYSQAYLSLLVRKGKLRAVKIGRNWVTKKEWLAEYIELLGGARIPKPDISKKSISNFSFAAAQSLTPVPAPAALVLPRLGILFLPVLLAVILFFAFGFWGIKDRVPDFAKNFGMGNFSYNILENDLSKFNLSYLENFARTELAPLAKSSAIDAMGKFVSDIGRSLEGGFGKISSGVLSFFNFKKEAEGGGAMAAMPISPEEKPVLEREIYSLEEDIDNYNQSRFQTFREDLNIGTKMEAGNTASDGLAVVMLTGDPIIDEQTQKKIQQSFSDNVTIKPRDANSGIIIPDFREKTSDEYLYMMVPVSGGEKK